MAGETDSTGKSAGQHEAPHVRGNEPKRVTHWLLRLAYPDSHVSMRDTAASQTEVVDLVRNEFCQKLSFWQHIRCCSPRQSSGTNAYGHGGCNTAAFAMCIMYRYLTIYTMAPSILDI
jgi:hypothetical protein